MNQQQIGHILEACLLVAGKAMNLKQLEALFAEDSDRPERQEIKDALLELQQHYQGRGIELVEVASGWRLQSAQSVQPWVGRLFQEKPPRYSRALLETLVLIAYRQPISRGEIEDVRGVAVSSNIMRSLQERDWIREMGHKDVPGRPVLWGTTQAFLDYFNLKRLDELPTLAEARDLADIEAALESEVGRVDVVSHADAANDDGMAQPDRAQSQGGEMAADASASDRSQTPESEPDIEPMDGDAATDASESGTSRDSDPELDAERRDGETAADASEPESPQESELDTELMDIVAGLPGRLNETQEEAATVITMPDVDSDESPGDQSDAESELRKAIDDFALEHRQQLDHTPSEPSYDGETGGAPAPNTSGSDDVSGPLLPSAPRHGNDSENGPATSVAEQAPPVSDQDHDP